MDRKRLRGYKYPGGYRHILSAWADELGLSIAQETVAEKRNELQVIPEVLDSLELSRAVISIDARGSQTAIAEQVVPTGSDYIFSLKGNHKNFFKDVQDSFTCKRYKSYRYESLEKNHGRIEKRSYRVLCASEVFCDGEYSKWRGLSSLVQVER